MAELAVENPLRVGLRLSDVPGPSALVIFGGSGDLAHRKLVPALYNLALRGLLPAGFGVIGVGRRDYGGDEGYRKSMRESVAKFTRRYESARFGGSAEDAQRLPELYEHVSSAARR